MIVTYNKVKDVFPTEGVTATVVVEADDARSGPVASAIDRLSRTSTARITFLPGPR